MKDNFEQIRMDVKRLHAMGVQLLNAMWDEQFPSQWNTIYQRSQKGLQGF